jgi:hypothetical protein
MTDETPGPAADKSQGPNLDEGGEFILATYREIAARFRLSGPNAARTKVKRAGWRSGSRPNHPADPLRIQIPREAWSRASEIPPRAASKSRPKSSKDPISQGQEAPFHDKEVPHFKTLVALLREQVERERLIADEARAERAAAERRAARAEDDLRAERDESRRRGQELARLAALPPMATQSPDLPSIREGLAALAAEFPPLSTEPVGLPSILEGLSELVAEFSVSLPASVEPSTPAEAPAHPGESPVRLPTGPAGLHEWAAERAAEPPVIPRAEVDQATATPQGDTKSVPGLPVERVSAPEPDTALPIQQDRMPVAVTKSRPWWLRRPGAF